MGGMCRWVVQGMYSKNTGDGNMYVSSNNLVSVYETGFVLRSLMA